MISNNSGVQSLSIWSSVTDIVEGFKGSELDYLPVINKAGRFIGEISKNDLLRLMVHLHDMTMGLPASYRFASEWLEFSNATAESILASSDRVSVTITGATGGWRKVAQLLVENNLGSVTVLDSVNSRFVQLITGSSILKNIQKDLQNLDTSLQVRDFIKPSKEVLRVHHSAKLIESFRFMVSQKVSALPIVGDDDRPIASASHIKKVYLSPPLISYY